MCSSATTLSSECTCIRIPLAAARRGDRDAFISLVSEHTSRMRRLAHRLTRSAEDAEDVCQESLLKAFLKLEQFPESRIQQHEFCAWLMKITTNCAIDLLRRKKASRTVPLEDTETAYGPAAPASAGAWGESPETRCTREQELELVANAVAQLPYDLRRVCLLRYQNELSTKEAAARLGISAIAVRLRLFRAQGRLREIVQRRAPRPHVS